MGRKNGMLSMVLGVSILVLIVIIVKVIPQNIRNSQKNTKTEQSQEVSGKKEKKKDKNIEQAKLLAMGYDYDGAINLLKSVKNYKENTVITKLIKQFEEQKAACCSGGCQCGTTYFLSFFNQ